MYWGRVSAAALAAAAFIVGCVCVAAEPARADDNLATFMLFSGADLWRDGRFLHGGVLWSPDGIVREGFTMQLIASGGLYRYRSGTFNNDWVIGAEEEHQILPGWRFQRERLEVKAFAGLDIKYDRTVPYDPGNRLHGVSLGARGTINVWFEPTPATMLVADASLSSISGSYSGRLAFGWRLSDWFYVGPEAQTFACLGFAQTRVGAHLTGLRTGDFEWSAAAGWAGDSEHRSGAYVRIGVLTRR